MIAALNPLVDGDTPLNGYSARDWALVSAGLERLRWLPLQLGLPTHHNGAPTLEAIEAMIRPPILDAFDPPPTPSLVIIDQLNLIAKPAPTDAAAKAEMGETVRELKIMALALGVPILLLAGLARNAGHSGARATLVDVSPSALETLSDIVLLLHRPPAEVQQVEGEAALVERVEQVAYLSVAKNRHGPTGEVELRWLPERRTFVSVRTPGDGLDQASEPASLEP
jgi:hypothetical protein